MVKRFANHGNGVYVTVPPVMSRSMPVVMLWLSSESITLGSVEER